SRRFHAGDGVYGAPAGLECGSSSTATRVTERLITDDSTRTTNGTVLPSAVVVVAVSGGYGFDGSANLLNRVVIDRAYQSTRVGAEQSVSSGLPRPFVSVSHTNGVWWGPEITGPVTRWSVTSSVARLVREVAVKVLRPTRRPLTTPPTTP